MAPFKNPVHMFLYMTVSIRPSTIFKLPDAESNRISKELNDEDRIAMMNWLLDFGISESDLGSIRYANTSFFMVEKL